MLCTLCCARRETGLTDKSRPQDGVNEGALHGLSSLRMFRAIAAGEAV